MLGKRVLVGGLLGIAAFSLGSGLAGAEPVALTLSASAGADGTTIGVGAPGCNPTPPGTFDIVVQGLSSSGEVGEGAVAQGGFTAPGQGSAVIPAGTPINRFLLSVSCNGGSLTGSQTFQLLTPATPVIAPINFTG